MLMLSFGVLENIQSRRVVELLLVANGNEVMYLLKMFIIAFVMITLNEKSTTGIFNKAHIKYKKLTFNI